MSTIDRTYTNNKFERPFSNAHAIHVTFRSSLAVGPNSFLCPRNWLWLQNYIPSLAHRLNIELYRWSVNGNHLHLVLRALDRKSFQTFLKVVASRTARFVLAVERGRAKRVRFWDKRPYSRLLTWGPEFKNVLRYVARNSKEALGRMGYVPRANRSEMRRTNLELDFELRAENPQMDLQI